MIERFWHSTHTAAAHSGFHPQTVRKACESGELHGSQRTKGGRWRIHRDCLDAWLRGEKCEHQ
ncbi:MAG TPA: helix-turn-helix domain-containing protein [Nocardioides sp.]|uniref:helix-turn-helix domain-containing protein n=1 Tax=Nocardioides sp. TaxID=35761 RepID=UPI002EDBB3CF